jgi:hypothetical protein
MPHEGLWASARPANARYTDEQRRAVLAAVTGYHPAAPSSSESISALGDSQLADVAGARYPDNGPVEIRIQMDRVDPPAGRLSVVADAGRRPGRPAGEISFTGWLGLLRALYEATGAPGVRPDPGL